MLKIRIEKTVGFGYFNFNVNFNMDNIFNEKHFILFHSSKLFIYIPILFPFST